jgi:hypothetical protein
MSLALLLGPRSSRTRDYCGVPSTTPLKQALANRFLIKTKWRWLQQWGAGLALPPTGREAIAQMSVAEPRQGVCHLRHSAGIDLGVIRCLSALGEADARQTSGQQSHNIAAPADHSGIKHSAIMRCDVRCDPERIDIGCLTHRELLADLDRLATLVCAARTRSAGRRACHRFGKAVLLTPCR